ncbi:MAG: type IV pili twitching motility protein PilT, partial [Sulfurovum sp.]
DALFEGKEIYGTQTFDQHLLDLIKADKITEEVALEYASSPSDLKLKMQGVGKGAILKNEDTNTPEDTIEFKDE